MDTDLNIKVRRGFNDGTCNEDVITLFLKTDFSPYGNNEFFIWEGSYNNRPIRVSLKRQTNEREAQIEGLGEELNIENDIINELKRVLEILN